jgi:hypothetical protein
MVCVVKLLIYNDLASWMKGKIAADVSAGTHGSKDVSVLLDTLGMDGTDRRFTGAFIGLGRLHQTGSDRMSL